MPKHSDRQATWRWAKIGPPPLGVASGSLSDGVTLLGRATSPPGAAFLAEKLPEAIRMTRNGRKVL